MLVELPYGKRSLRLKAPRNSLLLQKEKEEILSDPQSILKKALSQPIWGESLSRIITEKGARSACIVISDHTRPVPNKTILPPLLNEIENCGINPQSIKLLVAYT